MSYYIYETIRKKYENTTGALAPQQQHVCSRHYWRSNYWVNGIALLSRHRAKKIQPSKQKRPVGRHQQT